MKKGGSEGGREGGWEGWREQLGGGGSLEMEGRREEEKRRWERGKKEGEGADQLLDETYW